MFNLNYYIHLLLTSRYLLIINSFIIFIIFIAMREGHYAFCMNDTNIPEVAEPKIPIVRGIQVLTPLQMEVSKFLGYAETIQQQETIIAEQQEEIARLSTQLTTELAIDRDRIRQALPFLHNGTLDRIQGALDAYTTQQAFITRIFEETEIHRIVMGDRSRIVLTPEELDRINNRLTEQHNHIRRLTNDNEATSFFSWWLFGVAFLGYYSAWAFYGISPLKLFLGPIKW